MVKRAAVVLRNIKERPGTPPPTHLDSAHEKQIPGTQEGKRKTES